MAEIIGDQLLRLARDPSPRGRTVLTETISAFFDGEVNALNEREHVLVFDILRKVVAEAELAVRQRLSERLADRGDVPADLMRLLANDAIEVAYPVLRRSRVLSDADLIEVIRHRSREHQLSVTLRDHVGAEVSAELVGTGEPSVIASLLNNANAQISAETLAFLVEESRRVDRYQEPLLRRPELTEPLARRMYLWVAAALRRFIVERFEIDPATIDEDLEAAAKQESRRDGEARPPSASDRLADTLAEAGLITSAALIQTLAQGQVPLFLAMLARKTGLRPETTRRLVFSDRCGLAVACRAIGMDRASFARLAGLCAGGGKPADASVLRAYDQTAPAAARRIVRSWQRDPEFLAAIADVAMDEPCHAGS